MGRREIRELMTVLKEKGHTIFLNSHLLGEVELICDRVAILQQGEAYSRRNHRGTHQNQGNMDILGLLAGQTFPVDAVVQLGFPTARCRTNPGSTEVTMPDGKTIEPVMQLLSFARIDRRSHR